MITQQQFEKDATPTKLDENFRSIINSHDYVIGCDPYDRLNWLQNLFKKIGFYKNRPKVGVAIFKKNADGTTELIKL